MASNPVVDCATPSARKLLIAVLCVSAAELDASAACCHAAALASQTSRVVGQVSGATMNREYCRLGGALTWPPLPPRRHL